MEYYNYDDIDDVDVEGSKDNKWIQKAINPKSKGALHKYFNIPMDEEIPTKLLKDTLKDPNITEKTRRRINLALTLRNFKK